MCSQIFNENIQWYGLGFNLTNFTSFQFSANVQIKTQTLHISTKFFSHVLLLTTYRVSNHRPGKSNSVFQWDIWMLLIFSILLSIQYVMQFHSIYNKQFGFQLFVYNFLSKVSILNGHFLLLYLFLEQNYSDFSTWII